MADTISNFFGCYGSSNLFSFPLVIAQYTYLLRIKERKALLNSILQIVKVVEAKDVYTAGHSVRVAEYSEEIARGMGLNEYDIEILKNLANLHDIGKIQIDLSLLNKRRKLSDSDWKKIKRHPIVGYDIVKEITFLKDKADAVLYHHERIDGSGYPYGKKGDGIPLFAKILCVADSYDAMATKRPYREALSREQAIFELKGNSGKQFDPVVCETMIEILEKKYQEK